MDIEGHVVPVGIGSILGNQGLFPALRGGVFTCWPGNPGAGAHKSRQHGGQQKQAYKLY